LSLCTHPLYTRFAKSVGAYISEATTRPNPRSGGRPLRWRSTRRPSRTSASPRRTVPPPPTRAEILACGACCSSMRQQLCKLQQCVRVAACVTLTAAACVAAMNAISNPVFVAFLLRRWWRGSPLRSHCRFVPPHILFKPDSPRDSVPLFLKRQCERTLRAGPRAWPPRWPSGWSARCRGAWTLVTLDHFWRIPHSIYNDPWQFWYSFLD
jgi:hypothetical protein